MACSLPSGGLPLSWAGSAAVACASGRKQQKCRTKRGPAAEATSLTGCPPPAHPLQARPGTPAASLRHLAGQYVPELERSDTAGELQLPGAVKGRGMFLATTVVDVTKS